MTYRHIGNVMLTGRSTSGTSTTSAVTAALRARVTAASTDSVPLFIGTDQEGGNVQVLRGSGYSTMPTALTQGTWDSSTLQSSARTWGQQLHGSGINVNLAPVMDTVPSAAYAPYNKPIGYYHREFGYSTAQVADKGSAFLRGMSQAGVETSVKHFPGLGLVTANTDTTVGVRDTKMTLNGSFSSYVNPFLAGVNAGAGMVMMSSAIYSNIDAHAPACFSYKIITQVLRGQHGYNGIVISDDLGNAKAVSPWAPGTRAVWFLLSGGTMILTVNANVVTEMYNAVLARARSDASFRRIVQASCNRVLLRKAARGLIGGC
ncbi:glycoside hydrolase family 3 N-terminal domain-containing protein [Luteipulveratus halotolerans]|uniref:glycoside hydrolase family 3 N-terminal domain-containing protein n=1 Tax=Luteipulveratus halotolerans TaxID=1631356 RepID=UPI0022B1F4F8|nr:glycoside hydrolase family 3 N-terminal domain-containing protein [Luteipulveratus halotolerans]